MILLAQALAADDLRPLRGAVEIPEPTPIWPYVAAPLAIVLIAMLVYLLLRKKKGEPARRSAAEIALDELHAAHAGIVEGGSREYAYNVSDILRAYLERRFGLRAPRQTTEEFLAAVAADPGPPLGDQRELLADFLGHCDLGKFGKWTLDLAQMDALHGSAVRLVRATAATAPEPAPNPT
ncbi:hypothetical protein BH23VER1_BH23VER1_07520 [soil metagenome]